MTTLSREVCACTAFLSDRGHQPPKVVVLQPCESLGHLRGYPSPSAAKADHISISLDVIDETLSLPAMGVLDRIVMQSCVNAEKFDINKIIYMTQRLFRMVV
jgi:hypothetical protein